MAGPQAQDLHLLRQLNRELRVPLKVMDAGRIASGEGRHRLDALPIRDRHELGLTLAILAERLDPHRFLDQGLDPDLVIVGLVFISPLGPGAAAPDPSDHWTLWNALVLHGSCSSGGRLASGAAGINRCRRPACSGPGENDAGRAQAAAEDCAGTGMSASSISRARATA